MPQRYTGCDISSAGAAGWTVGGTGQRGSETSARWKLRAERDAVGPRCPW
jgi:hypothetical protein